MQKGFTLIEIMVVVVIITVLAGIVVFGIVQFISRGKDAAIQAGYAVLGPGGETYYTLKTDSDGNPKQDSYYGFCSSQFVQNTFGGLPLMDAQCPPPNQGFSQMSNTTFANQLSQVNRQDRCCNVASDSQSWAACVQEYSHPLTAFCVDSKGTKKEICLTSCQGSMSSCPSDTWPNCP